MKSLMHLMQIWLMLFTQILTLWVNLKYHKTNNFVFISKALLNLLDMSISTLARILMSWALIRLVVWIQFVIMEEVMCSLEIASEIKTNAGLSLSVLQGLKIKMITIELSSQYCFKVIN